MPEALKKITIKGKEVGDKYIRLDLEGYS